MPNHLLVNENHELFNREGMLYKEFLSDFRQVRYITLRIIQKAPQFLKQVNLLEQQISEIIKNAIKHGNKMDPQKNIKVWYLFSESEARLIVEDEGEGFTALEKWNAFNAKREELYEINDYDKMLEYVSFRTDASDDIDGGNSLFAAVEYWNRGVVYNNKKNAVAVGRSFSNTFNIHEGLD